MGVAAVISGIGLGLQAFGTISSSNAKAEAAEREAALQLLQADEVVRKAARDSRIIKTRGAQFVGDQVAAMAASGAASASGSNLGLLEQTMFSVEDEIAAIRSAAKFKSSQIRAGAYSKFEAAADTRTSGYISGFGGLLTGFTSALSNSGAFDGNDGSFLNLGSDSELTDLPAVGYRGVLA